MTEWRTIEDIKRIMLAELREAAGAQDAPGYVLWGVTPEELLLSLKQLAEEVRLSPAQQAGLRALMARAKERGYTVVAILFVGDRAYFQGRRIQLLAPEIRA